MKKIKKLNRAPQRIMLIISGVIILLAVLISATEPQSGNALAGDLSSAVSRYPNISSSSLNSCDFCHTASIPNLNPYGAAYKSSGRNIAAFGAIENLDSDNDGFSNIEEVNALTFPGNPASFPSIPTATNSPVPVSTNTSVPNPTNTMVPTIVVQSSATPIVVQPSATPIVLSGSANVTTELSPSSIIVGGSSTATVSLNSIPAGGYASAEFTCTFNPTLVEISNITQTSLFGTDPVAVVNGPQNGSFIVAIAGSNGNKALTSGAAFSFSATALQSGQSTIDCQARVSSGDLVLAPLPSVPVNLDILSAQDGTLMGQVTAGKLVTVMLYNSGGSVSGSVTANMNGTFSLSAPGGQYTAVASASGYLKAQGSISLTNGNTTTLQTISLPAGDIDGNDVIDQFDALTIGINYNGSTPTAADFNNDGTINVLDLEILAHNYRQSGSLAWQ